MNAPVRTVAVLMLAAAYQAAFAAGDALRPLNSIAVEVNSSIITYGDIARMVKELRANPANKDIPDEQLSQAAKSRLVERTLLADAARQQGLKVPGAAIDAELSRRAQEQKITVDALYQRAAAAGWSRSQYRLETAKDMLIERMFYDIGSSVRVSDGQIRQYIDQARAAGQPLPAAQPYTVYTVRRILLNAESEAQMDGVGPRAAQIAQALAKGSDFAAVARRYSQDSSAANGGLIEGVSDGMLPERVEAVLHSLQPGQMSPPIAAGKSWQIIQLVGSRTESDPAKAQYQAVRSKLAGEARQQALQQFVGQLQQSAVVREY